MVKAWKEQVVIPTYKVGRPEKNPMFLEKRVYQGSSGVVYPYPVIEKIEDEREDETYNAVYLENEYIKVMILPELGGRVQMAYDKIKERHFIYYNHVIKPALVGLTGPWISGGIEFNWPQHHRPSTYMPLDYYIENFEDGSITVWVSEIERMFHQKGMAGFTLYPGKAYLEVKGKLYNRTEMPQTFLWWANPAVAVNDHYQSVFPPDVNAVFDHGKRAVSSFPIATGTYYKVDYSAGVDISNYKNIPVPTSYMAINSKYNFVGGYENDTRAGVLHVANHHISPGKKQWTWGNGDFGRAWDRNLTDADGPYIELMAGVYTDNQPDFTWLQPYEEKSFVQYFLPYRELGVVKNANKDLLMNIHSEGEKVRIQIFATSEQTVQVQLSGNDNLYFNEELKLSPRAVFERVVEIGNETFDQLKLTLSDNRKELLSRCAEPKEKKPVPEAAEAALFPHEITSTEQLYLTGLHLEQYRHATYNPADYYKEALKRDPIDVRNNNALGLWYLRKGRFRKAEPYLRTAIKTLLKYNPNPYDGEPLYNLGVALKYQGRYDEAYDSFYKSCWNGAWQDSGYFACAQISMIQGREADALDEVDRSLIRNRHNHKARHLKVVLLRHTNRRSEAVRLIDDSLSLDRFNFGCLYEKYLITGAADDLIRFKQIIRNEAHNYNEIALDYVGAGCWAEAIFLLEMTIEVSAVDPMSFYYLGYSRWMQGSEEKAKEIFLKAASVSPNYCFPNRLEAILALQCAIEVNPEDAKAHYYLGNLWYDKRQYSPAVKAWETSAERDAAFPTVWRNLALAYFNKQQKKKEAIDCMERAFGLDTTDARVFMELDQLYKRVGRPHLDRLAFLRKYQDLVAQRDDLYLEQITLLNQTGRFEEAKNMLDNRIFHPWEGGEGKVPAQYQIARVELAKKYLKIKKYEQALSVIEECLVYPVHLGEGKLDGAQENDFYYFMGCAYEGLGNPERAILSWEKAISGRIEPAAAIYYNDQKPDKIFYQGLALLKLKREEEAHARFHKLLSYGRKHLDDRIVMDYFAVSLPDLLIWEDDLTLWNIIHCKYMMSLGYWGLGETEKAVRLLEDTERLDINNQGIQALHSLMDQHI
ncbi:MAG: DUF5107 domain-containing protein [Tannerellaceae bacterium]|jgi:tetratricopeptide (TPR) repeat protein|nr:DUF5107 domain-containing protein [Tannerellaceae bacterium]